MAETYKVLIKTNSAGSVIAITSDAFVLDFEGWIQIDEGYGDKYHHAQNYYLNHPLIDDRGIYRYKLVNGEIIERSLEEMEKDYVETPVTKNLEQRVYALENSMEGLEEGVREIISQ